MIEEQASVIEIHGNSALVETQRKTACSSCAVKKGCGTGVISTVFDRASARILAINTIGAEVGARVVVGIDESMLVRGSVVVYLMPILMMFGSSLLGTWLMQSDSEAVSIGFAGLGLLAGFICLRWYNKRIRLNENYQPVILRCVEPESNDYRIGDQRINDQRIR